MAAAVFGGSRLGSPKSRFLPNYYQFPQPCERLVTTDEGVRFLADVGTLLGWCLRFRIQDPSLNGLFGLLRPGMTVVDVGANIGFTALTAAKRVGPSGRVLAFEPHGANYAALQANLTLNPGLNVEALNVGLARAPGEANMVEPFARNPGGFRISSESKGETVVLEPLDEVLERHGVTSVDVLKIDTEGFELEVLSGSRRVLEESRPAIFIELSEDNLLAQASSTVDVISFLMDRGYRVREAVSGESMGLEADYAGCHCDAIALAVESADTPDSAL